jgi:hypothetical protein
MSKMKRLIIATAIFADIFFLVGLSAGYARSGMHGAAPGAQMAPASPTVPPSLTPDPRLTGNAPLPPHHQPTRGDVASIPDDSLKPDPEDAKMDRMIAGICRGC